MGSDAHLVATPQATRYKVQFSAKEHPIYDAGEDKLSLVEKVKQENNGAFNMDKWHEKVKEAGYHGWTNSKHPHWKHVVAMYHPLEVTARG